MVVVYHIAIIIVVVGMMMIAINNNPSSYSELYKNFDGRYIDKEIYESNVLICSKFQQSGQIDTNNVDCLDWVLSPEGNQWLADYWNFQLYG